jgi:hypothetical protein
MATRKFHITDSPDDIADGVISSPDKRSLGLAWQNDAPVGHFITGQLEGHWIITDEEKQLLDKAKKNEQTNTNITSSE